MHSQAALTIREWQRQDLLIDAERERLIRRLVAPTPDRHRGFMLQPPNVMEHLMTFAQAVRLRLVRSALA